MNGKKVAALILVMIIASIAYGAQMMQKQASGMLTEATQAMDECDASKNNQRYKDMEFQRLEFDSKDLRTFLRRWSPVILRIQTAQEAEGVLMSLIRNSGIILLSQKFEVKENHTNPMLPKAMQGTLILQDEYSKALNWLGELEKQIPLIRVNSCRIKQGENGRQINMEVHFEIPLVNLEAEIEQPKK